MFTRRGSRDMTPSRVGRSPRKPNKLKSMEPILESGIITFVNGLCEYMCTQPCDKLI